MNGTLNNTNEVLKNGPGLYKTLENPKDKN